MDAFTLVMLGILAAAAVALALWATFARPERLAERTSRDLGLALPQEPSRSVIVARVRASTRWTSYGAAVGALAAATACVAIMLGGTDPDAQGALTWLVFGGIVLGGATGAVLAVLTERQPTSDRPRVARVGRRTLRDYLDPIELIGARVAVTVTVVSAVASMIWVNPTQGGPLHLAAILLAAASIVALAIFEVAGRMVVLGRPRIVANEAELAWDDALRANDLRKLITAVLMTSCYGFVFTVMPLLSGLSAALLPGEIGSVAGAVLFYALLAAVVAVGAIASARKPAQFYLRRLWPQVAAAAAAQSRTVYSR